MRALPNTWGEGVAYGLHFSFRRDQQRTAIRSRVMLMRGHDVTMGSYVVFSRHNVMA